ncbi:NADPH:quinone oxidoreductase family protein [Meiothermus sp. QL-1]|uniref:quinone oxidoreductase family protein n=1 Tax=Meiothermus sp. QL-1 TaxID=2058095 RepID=UPI000E0A53F5|nr:NADPH:quinone oxidoreductase family protein [Meiothermus sp. QL-1]RDI95016.1 NADPH:quinone oxidoreductase family protein [Meiothermus sp. QL-1]
MKAVVLERNGPPENLVYREVPEPSLQAGEVRIRTLLTSLNFADVLARRGGYEAAPPLPFIPGLDVVGVVEALGAGVEGLRVGQRVAAFAAGGSYAEKVLAKAVLTYPVPDELPDEAVAGLTALVTAYNVLTWAGRLQPGETVLVHAAAGGVGSLAVQMARALGAGRVLGTVGHAAKAGFVRGLGADEVMGYEDFAQRVLELTREGADLILDSVAGEVFNQSLGCLAPFGRLVIYGHASGQPGHFETRPLHRQTKAIIGYSSGHYRRSRPERLRHSVEAVFELLKGRVRLPVGARFRLAEAARAHALMESRQSVGKILLYP